MSLNKLFTLSLDLSCSKWFKSSAQSVRFSTAKVRSLKINHLLSKMAKGKRKHDKLSQTNFPSFVTLNVLGNGALPNPRCLLLVTEFNKYLFNCGEGAQRAAVTHKVRLTGMHHIFVTHSSWDNIAGLPGMCLTLNTQVTAHGPLLHEKLSGITRTFDERNEIKFSVNNDYTTGFKDRSEERRVGKECQP